MTEIITGKTKIYCIIGYPTEHSFSPRMHNAVFAALNMDARFVAFSVKPNQLGEALTGLKALNVAGFNVTVPHKSSVIPHLDEVTPLAKNKWLASSACSDTILDPDARPPMTLSAPAKP